MSGVKAQNVFSFINSAGLEKHFRDLTNQIDEILPKSCPNSDFRRASRADNRENARFYKGFGAFWGVISIFSARFARWI